MELILKFIVVGFLAGSAISAGTARMFKAPEIQGMGAFRTLGEMNACHGDPISHFSFGLGFFITSAASVVGTGSLTQDVLHRVIPNWTAAIVGFKEGENYKTKTFEMFVVGGVVGAIVFTLLNTAASLVPADLATIAREILTPAATNMINYVMPLLFLWAAMDAGTSIGVWSIVFGGIMAIISGNSLPGIIFGILCGSLAEEKGLKDKSTITMFVVVVAIIVAIAYFRGFHLKLIGLFS